MCTDLAQHTLMRILLIVTSSATIPSVHVHVHSLADDGSVVYAHVEPSHAAQREDACAEYVRDRGASITHDIGEAVDVIT